jgi:hypothetical protein
MQKVTMGVSQIPGKIHTSATHGREPIALTHGMAVRALPLGLKFRMHPVTITGEEMTSLRSVARQTLLWVL